MIIVRRIGKQRNAFKSSIFREEVNATNHILASGVKLDFEKTVSTWEHKVKFKVDVKTSPNPSFSVTTTDEIYGYVDFGTKPHGIDPKTAAALAFNTKWQSKTVPNVIGSRKGYSRGPKAVVMHVDHPGTKPRNFTKLIAKKWKPEYQRQIKNALARAARRAAKG